MVKILKTSSAKPTVDCSPATTKQAQSSLAAVFTAVDKSQLGTVFWWNIIGVNSSSLMSLLRLDALVYHAFMLVAGLVEYKKMYGQDGYYLTSKKDAWDEFANAHVLGEVVEWTQARFEIGKKTNPKNGKEKSENTPRIGFEMCWKRRRLELHTWN